MNPIQEKTIECPHCGYRFKVEVDFSEGDQEMYEDCPQCCSEVHIHAGHSAVDGSPAVSVDGDDEQLY
ncbi:CPXCG motif-containing cysteine-rich protein [Corallincola platygyrae]|uniref:CPXCG motif-containing cysteine-rich protein n=1 Tax=Corallincola platygyrae TaxID=1193278 RepID=A0ABW4XL21_9GAMM